MLGADIAWRRQSHGVQVLEGNLRRVIGTGAGNGELRTPRHARGTLKADGHWLLVEPFANDNVTDNLNPLGRLFYSVSTLVCTPASLSQEVGAALGAQAGEPRLREVAQEAGFSTFHRATRAVP